MNSIQLSKVVSTSLSVTASNTAAALTSALGNRLVLSNLGPSWCYVRLGIGAQTAVTTDFPLAPSSQQLVDLPEGTTHIAAICDSGLATTLKASPVYEQF